MIKFRIFSKLWEVERCNFGEVLGKCQNYGFLCFLGHFIQKEGQFGSRMCKKEAIILPGQYF